jgi:hypothetical protein
MEREDHTRSAMSMTLDNLVLWAIGSNDNPLRRYIAELEIERRIAVAQIDAAAAAKNNARYTLLAVIVALIIGVGGWLIKLFWG